MLELEDTAEDIGGGDDESGDYLPQLASSPGRGNVEGVLGEQSASSRLARSSEQMQGMSSPSSARSSAEQKLAAYQLPSLELVRTSVRAQSHRAHASVLLAER